jgi:signal transduction histidine kinase
MPTLHPADPPDRPDSPPGGLDLPSGGPDPAPGGLDSPSASPGSPPAGTADPPWFARLARRLGHRPAPDAIDYAVAAGCFAVFTLPVLLGAASRAGSPLAVAGFGVLTAAPLTVRRRWPIATLGAVAAVYVAATLAGVRFTPFVSNAGPNFAIAVFTAADLRDRRSSLAATIAAGLVTWAVLPLGIHLYPGQDQDAVQLLAAGPAWIAGDIVRVRRGYRQHLALEARRRAAEAEGRARAEERLRLSRDVHDVVSHSLSTIAVRSGVARLLLDDQPEEARAALTAIETASRSALDELRQLLRQIREPAAERETATPTLDDLPALVDRLRRDGLDLCYRSTGQPRPYGTALELSAYRIAQEALTNVVKHARAAHAWVEVAHGESEITITVTDDGRGPMQPVPPSPGPGTTQPAPPSTGPGTTQPAPPPASPAITQPAPPSASPAITQPAPPSAGPGITQPAPPSAGLGIIGMRERATMLGGQLTAQARPEGGFAVVARLPAGDSRE